MGHSTMKSVLFLLVVVALASASWVVVDKEEPMTVPEQWKSLGAAEPLASMDIIIALKQRNLDIVDQLFWQVSDPQHPHYGKYLSTDQLKSIVKPAAETTEAVEAWLEEHNAIINKKSHHEDFLFVTVSVAQLSEMVNADFELFVHENGARAIRTVGPYFLPSHLAQHIDVMAGLTYWPLQASDNPKRAGKVGGETLPVTPSVIRQRYNVTMTGSNKNNSQAVAEFQDQFYSPSDLTTFFTQYVPNAQPGQDQVTKVVGTNSPSSPGTEAELDIQYIMGVAPGVPSWFYITEGDFFTALLQWISSLETSGIPWVHSVSYGLQSEFDPSRSTRDSVNAQFQKAGVLGLTIIFASGDYGCGCEFCFRFAPSFPATSPFVTSVGATEFYSSSIGPERAVEEFGSGGGFSWYFAQPGYQSKAVQQYLTTAKLPSSHYFNSSGRGTPDISALGEAFQVIQNGIVDSVAGTSCSAPTAAAIISLLNEIRLNANKATLGFINPFLYQTWESNPTAFYDVTEGSNSHTCCEGFQCAPGWDPVTGLGTLNFAVLSKLV